MICILCSAKETLNYRCVPCVGNVHVKVEGLSVDLLSRVNQNRSLASVSSFVFPLRSFVRRKFLFGHQNLCVFRHSDIDRAASTGRMYPVPSSSTEGSSI